MICRNKTLSVLILVAFFAGCGDDKSPESRQAEAQRALDKGECETAVSLFDTLQKEDLNNVDRRLDLSAAYLCRAGFSIQGLLKVVADFSKSTDKEGAKDALFKNITEQVSAIVPDTGLWRDSVCKSKALLGELNGTSTQWPCASKSDPVTKKVLLFGPNNPDAGYILSIVNLADATLTVADALNAISGIATCASTASCGALTSEDLLAIANSLLSAQQSISTATGTGGELSDTTGNLVFNADTDQSGALTDSEVLNYLLEQKIITNTNPVGVPPNCSLNPTTNKYACTPPPTP